MILDGGPLVVWNLVRCQDKLGITAGGVPATRLINTTAPLTGGGDLSADRTLSIPAATNAVNGYLTAVDHALFSAKESALTFTPPLTRTVNTVAWTGTTTDVPEGANLYYTAARFNTAFSGKSTTDLVEGTNLYYTQARFDTAFAAKSTTNLVEGTNLYYTQARFDTAFAAKSTTNLAEGSNLYYTDARARAAFSGTSPIAVSAGGVVSISAASATAAGSESAADFIAIRNVIAMGRGAIYLS